MKNNVDAFIFHTALCDTCGMEINMRMYDIIKTKRDGGVLSKEQIDYFVKEYTNGMIPDYQVAALLMAVYFQGMNEAETLALTLAMAESGDCLSLSAIHGVTADKHSTGGVGDKTTLVLAPMAAVLGVKMAKMSGRGLGHTGGTIDKLESFPGFSTALSEEKFIQNVNTIGMAITGQTGNLAPADKKLYALRDVTDTVDSLPLIASSIMSKKIAAGADTIVLDVKVGSGAFMKTEEAARKLAKEMVRIGHGAGRKTAAVISEMDEPLGFSVGNALEVIEAIDTLKGNGPKDLEDLCVALGSYMLVSAGKADSLEEAADKLRGTLKDGSAYEKMIEFVTAQGGSREDVENPQRLLHATYTDTITAPKTGYIAHIQSEEVGLAAMTAGGGRETKDSVIDLSAGIVLNKKVGDFVKENEPLARLYANDKAKLEAAKKRLAGAYSFSEEPVPVRPLIHGVITEKDI